MARRPFTSVEETSISPEQPRCESASTTMKLRSILLVAVSIILSAWTCEETHWGCKTIGASCKCDTGCKTEYIYKSRRACRNALRAVVVPAPAPSERSADICSSMPCSRGICAQTTNYIGFTCKCEGTGFYGQRCEKACPTTPIRGMVFPHECVVI